MARATPRIVLLTGMAGAGKTTAVRAFEDLGFFCVDNLPMQLLDTFLALLERNDAIPRAAIVMDAREEGFARHWPRLLESAARAGHRLEIVFLDATDAALIRRFSETRRRHPLSPRTGNGRRGGTSVASAIGRERAMLRKLRAKADLVIDTSDLNVHQLKAIVGRHFGGPGAKGHLTISVLSFGFRYGPPREADLMLDVRFLPNPHFMKGMREKTGLDPKVARKVLGNKDGREFVHKLEGLLAFLIPRYRDEGKAYLTIGVGCTGGRHRSVAVAERLGKDLARREWQVNVVHRDLERS